MEKKIELELRSEVLNELCDRLTKKVDWIFAGTKKDLEKLNKDLDII